MALQEAASKLGRGHGAEPRDGLEAEFRRTLRVVADPDAFTERQPHPKADGVGAGGEEGAKKKGRRFPSAPDSLW